MAVNINDFIGKYGSAINDAQAYIDAVNIQNGTKNYQLTPNESQKILNYYHKKQSGNGNDDDINGGKKNIITKISEVQNFSPNLVGSNSEVITSSGVVSGVTDILNSFFGKKGDIKNGFNNIYNKLKSGAEDMYVDILKNEVELRAQLNSKLGVAGELSENYREEIMRSLAGVTAMKYGFEDLTSLTIGLAEQTGKFTTLNEKTIRETAITARAFVGNLSDMANAYVSFGDVGIGVEATNKAINEAGTSSLGLGLNAKKTVDTLRSDIGKLNEYGFQNGIQGLTRMIQKSTEFKVNMNEIYKIAEEVMNPERAIEMSANLSVLGGAIGDFADPFKMMYDSTNNVEGLQDALISAASSLSTYNSEQGRFEVTGANLRRAREMATALGMSLSDLTKTSIAAAERSSAAADLMSSGLKLDDKQTEFITNLARMKDGKMVIDVSSISKEFGNAQQIALDQLTESQVKILEKNQNALKVLSPEDIARGQFTATQNLLLEVSDIANLLKVRFKQSGVVKFGEDLTDTQIKKLTKYTQDARAEKPGNHLGSFIRYSRTGDVNDIFNNGNVKKQEPVKVNNKTKKEEVIKPEFNIKQQFKEALSENEMMIKNNKGQNVVINTELQPENPNSYLSYQIGGR